MKQLFYNIFQPDGNFFSRGICLLTSWACTIGIYIISSVMHAFWLVLTYDLLEDRRIDDVIVKTFFNSLLYKTNRFQVAVRLFSNRSQRTWDGRTWVTHSAAPRVPHFCSYHILTSSVIYFWTDARQLGIYLSKEARSRNWIWSDKFPSYVIIVLEKIYSCLFISNYTRNHVITYTN